jgi:HAMP domain-containing protein
MTRLARLRLGARFTLVLVLFFLISIGLSGFALYRHLTVVAEQSVSSDGLLLLHAMNAVRAYTASQINPLLTPQMAAQSKFIPETVPAFSARSVFNQLRKDNQYGTFSYKEASANPTAPQDRADDWETQVLMRFVNDRGKQQESGFRTLSGQLVFYSARPLVVSSTACLQCHSAPDKAPAAMVAQYGPINGFGWKVNDVIAAQIVYVPATEVFSLSQSTWLSVMLISVLSFALAVLAINLVLRRNVVRPVDQMAELARKISADEIDEGAPDSLAAVARRSDELGQMAQVFQRMAREVYAREQTLKQQVEQLRVGIIEIDEARKTQRVAELVESDSFKALRAKAMEYRHQRHEQEGSADGAADGQAVAGKNGES